MTALEDITHPKVQLPRPPANPEELWWVVRTLWGVTIPRTAVCGDHVAPFTAFAEGYFGNDSNIVLWYGSRGTGKSLLLALLALTKAAILEINVTLLGGSMAQSNNVQEHIESLLTYPGAPSWAVAQQIQTQITFSGGNWIRPLPASQKTVRGPHPQMTCLADWTMVASPDGDRTIGQLEAGQRVYVSDDLVTPREGVVLGVIDQGWKITVDVIADRARLACTSDHRIHTQRGWVEAGHLVPGDVLTMWQSPGAVVQRVDQRGPYVHVWDITTDAGNFYADGVLVHNCLDEIDEMDRKVYDAAMGQAMSRPNARGIIIPEMVVASSTWQNPVGTFQEVRDEFLAKGLPVRTWCWREVLRTEGNPDGWMDPEFVERKRKAVPAEMFRVEYDLGEPAGGSRAFDLERLNAAFVPMVPVSERHAGSDDEWVFEAPVSTGWYAVGADWAKESDRTVIVVARIDESVRRVVYVRCVNRRPWPEMAGMFNDVLRRYANVVAAHDGTGIGNVVNDLIDERALKFIMSGRKRSDMLVDYISAVEQGRYRLPVGCTLLSAHKATTVEDVYAPGKWNGHLPDEVAACALAHYAAEHGAPVAAMVGVERSEYRPRATKELYPEGSVTVVGDVRNVTGVDDGGWNFLV